MYRLLGGCLYVESNKQTETNKKYFLKTHHNRPPKI